MTGRCAQCFVELPHGTNTTVCDFCGDPAAQPYEPPAARVLSVIHSAAIERRDHDKDFRRTT